MAYILTRDLAGIDHIAFKRKFDEYFSYLKSVKEKLPQEVFDFAMASWHYDFSDHRCPHDSWVEYLNIIELSSGERRRNREIEIKVRLLGAYHDGYLDLIYKGVQTYALAKKDGTWHGDWHRDEIRLSEEGLVLHEVDFIGGDHWIIVCRNIEYKWIPFENKKMKELIEC